jgi:hypothetical protein
MRSKKWSDALAKMQEIRGLDAGFEDGDGIAGKAQAELDREVEETSRQSKLAAKYAEAVRLAGRGMYSEALERWQEIRALDPTYPDRQSVERRARKALAASAEAHPVRARIALPRRFIWLSLGAISALALIIVALNLAFSGGSDLYDDFERSTFQGAFNPELWRYDERSPGGEIRQDQGVLVLTQDGVDRWTTLAASHYQAYTIEESGYMEAQLRIAPGFDGFVKIIARTSLPGAIPMCGLHALTDQFLAQCWTRTAGSPSFPVEYGAWHTARIEVDVNTNSLRYFMDGRLLAEDKFERLKGAHLWFSVGVHAGPDRPPIALPVTGFVDKVRIGSLP